MTKIIDNPYQTLSTDDEQVYQAILNEQIRQKEKLELIASENYVSPNVLAVTGSILTNKYAEGYPDKRYYGGCENVDVVENLAIERVTELFGAQSANVQPHSGSQANMAAYLSLIKPGDKILGMDLACGGHLTHGASVSFSGFLFQACSYGVRQDDKRLDYDEIASIAKKQRPQMIIAGSSAYSRHIDFKAMRQIADAVGAYLVVDMAHIAGLVAGRQHPSPVEYAHIVTSTTHKTLRGPRGGIILAKNEFIKKVNSKIFPGIQGGPLCHVIAAKAVAFKEALASSFTDYAKQVVLNATTLAESLIEKGYDIVSGGTDNHLMLVDLSNKNLTGKLAEQLLDKANITVNKNTVPFETKSPFVTSGIRLGSAALTTRGFLQADMVKVAEYIDLVLKNYQNDAEIAQIAADVREFSASFKSMSPKA